MQILSIYDPDDLKILHTPSRQVTNEDFDNGSIERIITSMKKHSVLYPNSVWFSAIQFGLPLQIFYINCRPTESFPHIKQAFSTFVINPKITSFSSETVDGYEWCMSITDAQWIPTHRRRVQRSTNIVVDYRDEKNKVHKWKELYWFPAIIFQHEYDHLQGILIDSIGYERISQEEYMERKKSGEKGLIVDF